MKDHEKRELVNRLTALAQKYAQTEQLRERIAELEQAQEIRVKALREALAREAKLREALDEIGNLNKAAKLSPVITQIIRQALTLPTDDTALKEAIKQAKKEALLEAANLLFESTEEPPINGNQLAQMRVSMIAEKLRYLAEELK